MSDNEGDTRMQRQDGSMTGHPPLLVVDVQCNYTTLMQYLRNCSSTGSSSRHNDSDPWMDDLAHKSSTTARQPQPLRLPSELLDRIASFLTIQRVDMEHVRCTGCSSTYNETSRTMTAASHNQAQNTLHDSESTWWISAEGSMPGGVGHEWIEYQLIPTDSGISAVRLSAVHLKIPPLPQGPLSVRTFVVQGLVHSTEDVSHNSDGESRAQWQSISPNCIVDNVTGWQRFPVAADQSRIRILCHSNQMSVFLPAETTSAANAAHNDTAYSSVGFFSIKFE